MRNVIKLKDCPFIPWKNGGGVTQELLRKGDEPFNFRISVAKVSSDGPFSLFPEHKRVLILLKGKIHLKISDKEVDLSTFELFSFSGDESVNSSNIEGEIQDFNVIFLKDMKVEVKIVEVDQKAFELKINEFLYIADGEVKYDQEIYSETLFQGPGILYPQSKCRGIYVKKVDATF